MIIKGGSRGRAGDLAAHLQRLDTNERMQILGMRDVAGVTLDQALREMEAYGSATRCKAALYHASISPRADEALTPAQWAQAVERLEHELGLDGQPRVVVAHVKEGRAHVHAVWSRIDLEHLRAISDSWNYAKHEQVARDLEREFGLSRIQGAHAKRDGVPRPERTPSAAEMSQSERSGIDPKARKAELTALWQASDSGAAFAAAAESAGYLLAHGDRRAYVVVDAAGEVYALARQLAGVKTAEVKARLADLPADAVPDVEQARALQAARNPAKDAPSPMNQSADAGLSLEEQRRAELAKRQAEQAEAARQEEARRAEWRAAAEQLKREQDQAAEAQKAEIQKADAARAEAIRQEEARKAEQAARDEQQRREMERIAGLARDAQAAELAKLEAARLDALRQAQERAAAYLAERERQAEEAKRAEAERTRGEAERSEAARVREGAIRNASDRYTQALGQHYDVANPYGSLARAAMAEAGAFSRDQEALRQQAAAEDDPGKRQLLVLRQEIEAKEHFAQVGNRVARLHEALTEQPDRHWQMFAAEQAAQAVQLRAQYRELAAEQEKARAAAEQQKAASPRAPDVQPEPPNPPSRAAEPEPEKTAAPPTEARAVSAAEAAQERQARKDQEARAALAQEHAKQREALDQRRASEAEHKALEERQRKEQQRLEMLQNKREIERQRAKEVGRER
jgi:hypothetical protein